MTISKSQAEGIQAKVKAKGCANGKRSQTISPKPMGKATKEKKVDLKQDNWIGSEYDFQVAVARLLDSHKLDWFHTPNEAKRLPRIGAKLKKAGMKAGIPDVIILNKPKMIGFNHQPVGLVIELKVGKNKQTVHQEYWGYKFTVHDWIATVAYGMNDVIRILSEHYGI